MVNQQALPRIVFLGPPGAGKGTQAMYFSSRLGIPHIPTGDLLKSAMRAKTPLGLRIQATMDAGLLVSTEEINELLIDRLSQPDCALGWSLDGYPRRIDQAEALDRIATPTLVILLDVDDEVAKKRMADRRVCANGHVFTKSDHAFGQPCRYCATPLVQRTEDAAPETRLSEYHKHTEPVIAYYQAQGKLEVVAGSMPIHAITAYLIGCPSMTRFFDAQLG